MTKFTSKVKMPEPVAWRITKGVGKKGFLTDLASDADICLSTRGGVREMEVTPLITTEQAEAYTNQRVKEVLEYLKTASMNSPIEQDLVNDDGAKATAWHISAKIRALINDDME